MARAGPPAPTGCAAGWCPTCWRCRCPRPGQLLGARGASAACWCAAPTAPATPRRADALRGALARRRRAAGRALRRPAAGRHPGRRQRPDAGDAHRRGPGGRPAAGHPISATTAPAAASSPASAPIALLALAAHGATYAADTVALAPHRRRPRGRRCAASSPPASPACRPAPRSTSRCAAPCRSPTQPGAFLPLLARVSAALQPVGRRHHRSKASPSTPPTAAWRSRSRRPTSPRCRRSRPASATPALAVVLRRRHHRRRRRRGPLRDRGADR